jgi:hypothetical protein
MDKHDDADFSSQEVQRRFEAALRGARIAGHKPMTEIQGQKPKAKKAKSPGKCRPVKKSAKRL